MTTVIPFDMILLTNEVHTKHLIKSIIPFSSEYGPIIEHATPFHKETVDGIRIPIKKKMAICAEAIILLKQLIGQEMAYPTENHVDIAMAPEIIPLDQVLECQTIGWFVITEFIGTFQRDFKAKGLAKPVS